MTRIVIDPATRIEGHLRIEAEVDDGLVRDAWCAGTQFRGMEIILKGRDPREAWIFAQRICGVCTTVHAITSVRAVENALQIQIPDNANLLRNIVAGIQFVHDHLVHFYHLHLLDWIDPSSALNADPSATSRLAQSISDWPNSSAELFEGVQDQLKTLVDSGKLSIFTNAHFGHPAYRLSPEENLLMITHYIDTLSYQREIAQAHALIGGKNPHPQTYSVGGMAVPLHLTNSSALNLDRLGQLRTWFREAREYVERVYWADVLELASHYTAWFSLGASAGNYLCYGEFTDRVKDESTRLFPSGILLDKNSSTIFDVDPTKITEDVTHSWYRYQNGTSKHPSEGETIPDYSGPEPPYEHLDTNAAYSWNKSPRYQDRAMEVGPLARVLVAYASGETRTVELLDSAMNQLNIGINSMHSTMGRTIARAIETLVIAEQLEVWLDRLQSNMESGDLSIHNNELWNPSSWPDEASGFGLHEAPRGGLGHWVRIKDEAIENYQCVVPTTWNASPRDRDGQRGPYETALLNTPIADEIQPIEMLRTVHSFDPCMACAAHLFDARGKEISQVRVL